MRIGENPWPHGTDEHHMHEALRLAELHMGHTSPNPAVGCVLVRNGVVIGRGAHHHVGQLHAERMALQDAGEARGAECFVSLEPCSHVGRQPSCCAALIESGVRRVVYGATDSDERSSGRAAQLLSRAGIEVRPGVLAGPCERFIDHYQFGKRHARVFIHLKMALSLDARLACPNGASQWLSGPQSLGLAHYLRWKYDAVLVGYRTVLHDNPRLTVRPGTLDPYWPGAAQRSFRQPGRVVLDPRFELLPRLLSPADSPLALADRSGMRDDMPQIVLAGQADSLPDVPASADWLTLIGLPLRSDGSLDLGRLAAELYRLGLRSLLVEGGGGVASSLLAQRLVDKLSCVYTPLLIGSDGIGFSPALGLESLELAPQLAQEEVEVLGRDVALTGRLRWPS